MNMSTGPGNAPINQLARLKRRVNNLNLLISGLNKQLSDSNNEAAIALVNRAKANYTTANNLSDTADILFNQSPLDSIRTADLPVEVAVVSFEDVSELDALRPLAEALAPPKSKDEPIITFLPPGANKGCSTCGSPDPTRWFEQFKSGSHEPAPAAVCETPRVVVKVPVDLNSKITRVDELIKLTEATLALAEQQVRAARSSICQASGSDSCSL